MHIIYLYSSKQAGLINVCTLIFSHPMDISFIVKRWFNIEQKLPKITIKQVVIIINNIILINAFSEV